MAGIKAINSKTPSKGKRTKNQDRWLLKSIDNVFPSHDRKPLYAMYKYLSQGLPNKEG